MQKSRFRNTFFKLTSVAFVTSVMGFAQVSPAWAQEQDAETKALDSTATQWSFQFAYQATPDYFTDILDSGQPRPIGTTDYLQLRILAPLPFESFTILPRITLRHYENQQGQSGLGNTEIFGLIVPKSWDWGTGRMGIGPLITLPGDEKVARDEWGYGFAAAYVNGNGPWFYGLLFTQSWRSVDPQALPAGSSDTNPLGIAPIVNYRLGDGWYVSNGDQIIQYDWDAKKFKVPLGVRFGRVLVKEKGSWNIYAEYQTSLVYKDWPGSAVENSYRINVTYTIPPF
ncbi:MAG: hypothetical protein WBM61_18060 [Woeseiaceae bacterium]